MYDERTERAMRYRRHVAREKSRQAIRRSAQIAVVSFVAWAITLTLLIVR